MKNLAVLAVIIQPLLLIVMTVYGLAPHFWGKQIVVKTELYDPRDLFRGNYVDLSYDFNRMQAPQDQDENKTEEQIWDSDMPERDIYAILEADKDGIYHTKAVVRERPSEGVYLLGKERRYNGQEFGVEAFFLPKDKALMLEKRIREISDEEDSLSQRAQNAARRAQNLNNQHEQNLTAEMNETQEENLDETQANRLKYTTYAYLKVLQNGMARIESIELVDNKTGKKISY